MAQGTRSGEWVSAKYEVRSVALRAVVVCAILR